MQSTNKYKCLACLHRPAAALVCCFIIRTVYFSTLQIISRDQHGKSECMTVCASTAKRMKGEKSNQPILKVSWRFSAHSSHSVFKLNSASYISFGIFWQRNKGKGKSWEKCCVKAASNRCGQILTSVWLPCDFHRFTLYMYSIVVCKY